MARGDHFKSYRQVEAPKQEAPVDVPTTISTRSKWVACQQRRMQNKYRSDSWSNSVSRNPSQTGQCPVVARTPAAPIVPRRVSTAVELSSEISSDSQHYVLRTYSPLVTPRTAVDNSPLSSLVGDSVPMKQVARLLTRMAKSRFPVLILGETGTGKEVVARAIHNLEQRGQFIVVDCSSLVGPLMESELFGYAKGAFTGAHVQKLGLLDAANGGTAFLDEIGELPLDMQQKLLRVLQEKEFRAVGGLSQRLSNFRVIAATNRNLASEVEKGRFRQDLYYRLDVMQLHLPPLRERREDVPLLISHFMERHGNGHQVPSDVMETLTQYDWPGNVRELEHAVQQMVAMNSGQWISKGDLPSTVANHSLKRALRGEPGSRGLESPFSSQIGPSANGVIPLAEVEKRAILRAMDVTKGDRTLAAAMLEIGRTTLYRKLKDYAL